MTNVPWRCYLNTCENPAAGGIRWVIGGSPDPICEQHLAIYRNSDRIRPSIAAVLSLAALNPRTEGISRFD